MRPHTLSALTALCAFTLMGAGPADSADPEPPPSVARAQILARVVEHLRAELASGQIHPLFRHMRGPQADVCHLYPRALGGWSPYTTLFDIGLRRWASASRRTREAGRQPDWTLTEVEFDASGRPTRVRNRQDQGRVPGVPQTTLQFVWFDEGPVLARRWFATGWREAYVLDAQRPGLVRVSRARGSEPLVEHHTLEISGDRMTLRVSGSPDVFVAYTWRADGSLDGVASSGQREPVVTHYDPNGILSNTPPWEIESDDAGRPVAAYSGGAYTHHFLYDEECDWPESFPTFEAPRAAPAQPGEAR